MPGPKGHALLYLWGSSIPLLIVLLTLATSSSCPSSLSPQANSFPSSSSTFSSFTHSHSSALLFLLLLPLPFPTDLWYSPPHPLHVGNQGHCHSSCLFFPLPFPTDLWYSPPHPLHVANHFQSYSSLFSSLLVANPEFANFYI